MNPELYDAIRAALERSLACHPLQRKALKLRKVDIAKRFHVSTASIYLYAKGLTVRPRYPSDRPGPKPPKPRPMICETCNGKYRIHTQPMTGITLESCECGTRPLGRAA